MLGGTQVGSEFENKSKEGDTCKLLKTGRINITNGFVPPSELWTKVEPDFSVTGSCTIFHDAYYCEVPLKECSQYQQLPELAVYSLSIVFQNAWICQPGQCPQWISCLGME